MFAITRQTISTSIYLSRNKNTISTSHQATCRRSTQCPAIIIICIMQSRIAHYIKGVNLLFIKLIVIVLNNHNKTANCSLIVPPMNPPCNSHNTLADILHCLPPISGFSHSSVAHHRPITFPQCNSTSEKWKSP